MNSFYRALLAALCCTSITACSGLFDKDNTPAPTALQSFHATVKPHLLWSVKTGNGSDNEYLKMTPSTSANAIIATSSNGTVTALQKLTGQIIWRNNTKLPISTGAGIGDGLVVVAGRKGNVTALDEATGKLRFSATIAGEILAKPAIENGIIIVKTVGGNVYALSAQDGRELWVYQQTEPNLLLHGASAPLIEDRSVIVGFANGNLAKLTLSQGELLWEQAIAIPEGAYSIQRMIDIDADPILYNRNIYAATYQGKIASLDWASGRIRWSHDISSYTGMTADDQAVYVTDAEGFIWAFSTDEGSVKWRQLQLRYRGLSAPASMGNYVVAGDSQGYLHWLDKSDGRIVGRTSIGSAIYASPVVNNGVLYAFTKNGRISAYNLTG